MNELNEAVRAVEHGLLQANQVSGQACHAYGLGERMAFFKVPGFSIALIDQDSLAWAQGYGVLEAGKTAPVTTETIFQAASISKTAAAMLALYLVETGTLDLDRDVNEMLRTWQVSDNEHTRENKVTLRGLLSHTAGLTVSGYPGFPYDAPRPTLLQILEGEEPARSDPVRVFQRPGTAFSYSGGGYVLLQLLIEDVTGERFADLAREIIFEPLGMANSTFETQPPAKTLQKAARAHWITGEPIPGKWHFYPEQPAASLWTTPSDLARLVVEVLHTHAGVSNRVLSTAMVREMLTPQVGWVGLGFPIIEVDGWTRFDHPGWNEGFHSLLVGYPGKGQGVIWMTNGENGRMLGYEVMRGLAHARGWPGFDPAEKAIAQVAPGALATFEGQYQSIDYPDFGVEIFLLGEQLALRNTPNGKLQFLLHPESALKFFSPDLPETVTFALDTDGLVETIQIGASTVLVPVK
jgi:CubicO group peptidase (beta-lactamase class C family)